jgi:hypothetical protein
MGRQRQSRLRNGRAGDVAAQPLQLTPPILSCSHRYCRSSTAPFRPVWPNKPA